MSAAKAFKAALLTACQSLYQSPILVSYGWPQSNPPELVVVGDVTSEQTVATMGVGRSREESLTCEVAVCVFQGGVIDQQPVSERAFDLAGQLETYLRDAGVIASTKATLGNAVRQASVIGLELIESDDEDLLKKGRAAIVNVTVAATVRL